MLNSKEQANLHAKEDAVIDMSHEQILSFDKKSACHTTAINVLLLIENLQDLERKQKSKSN